MPTAYHPLPPEQPGTVQEAACPTCGQPPQAAALLDAPPAGGGGNGVRANLLSIAEALEALRREAAALRRQMAALEAQGISEAGTHWRKDRRGERTILELVYSVHSARVQSGQRRVEYIGQNPAKQKAALARLDRFKEHAALKERAQHIEAMLRREEARIAAQLWRLRGEQPRLPGA